MGSNCLICGNRIGHMNTGRTIKAGELCEDCYNEGSKIVSSLNKFRVSQDFEKKEEIIKKLNIMNQQLGKWTGDSAEIVHYFNEKPRDLQITYLSQLVKLMRDAGFSHWADEAKTQHDDLSSINSSLKKLR
ncbi:hypothetical protein J4438_00790 [Candidatus Woesearchaeota archaeon]|nr:hypothetical protein [Candidatus Woesearchaeota archaeon]